MDISVLEIAPQTVAVLTFLVIAVVKLIDQLFARDWAGSLKIVFAALTGLAVSFGVDGLTALAGIVVGLSGSGLITTVGFFGKKSPELG